MSGRSPHGSRVAALAAAALLLVSACASTTGTSDAPGEAGRFAVDVDVDTPELRAARRVAGIADCPAVSADGPAVDDPLPEVSLPCLGGTGEVDLASLRGPMVLNLWAQWCGPCREELPYYQQLHERAGGDVAVLGVDYQDTRPDWAIDLLRESGVTYPSLADPGGELRVPFRVRGLPGAVFVDERGSVVAVEYVAVDSYAQLAGLVEKHLGVGVGAAG